MHRDLNACFEFRPDIGALQGGGTPLTLDTLSVSEGAIQNDSRIVPEFQLRWGIRLPARTAPYNGEAFKKLLNNACDANSPEP